MQSIRLPLLLASLLAACSGGGGSSAPVVAGNTGSVHVVLDTAAGSSSTVQVQVVAATLEDGSGSSSANVLAAPRMVRLTDPSGEIEGLELEHVGSGSYRAVHLGIAPGSGTQLLPDGSVVPVTVPLDLRVAFAEDLQHDASGSSWLTVGHDVANVPAAGGAWAPSLSGRSGGSAVALRGLSVAFVNASELTVQVPVLGNALLKVAFAPGCELGDDDSGHTYANGAAFLSATSRGDDVVAEGDIFQNGRFEVHRAHRRGHGLGNTGTRLIGRITALETPTVSFVMDVYAEATQGVFNLLPAVEQARVFATGARIEGHRHSALVYGDLAVGQLVKVEWTTRTIVANGPDEFTAHEIEVSPSGGAAMQPEWQGLVQSVDLQQRELTVVQRGNDPIVIGGVTYASVTVRVAAGVSIERRATGGGGGRTAIALEDIAAGTDAIWWRGTEASPGVTDASWVRVRATN